MEFIPASAEELVSALDKEFPHRCIEASQDPVLAHRYAGKRELVDWLIRITEDTREEMLKQQTTTP